MKHRNIILAALVCCMTIVLAGCGKDDDNNAGNTGANMGNDGETTAQWVDLGLPSGLLWASCNLGANSPEEYGNYYAWGETSTKTTFDWNTYAYGSAYNELTKYCNDSDYGLDGYIDNRTTLEAMDDAATQALAGGARTPSKEDWEELMDNTTSQWTTVNGVYGRKFTATNGATLFLPAAGSRWDDALYGADRWGYYWSATLDESTPDYAWYFSFESDDLDMESDSRFDGHPVRPVRSAQ